MIRKFKNKRNNKFKTNFFFTSKFSQSYKIIPNLKNFIEAIEKYDDIRDTTRKGIYVSSLSFLYRRNGLADDIEFTYSLINKIDALDGVLNSDFSILDNVLGGTPYNFERV